MKAETITLSTALPCAYKRSIWGLKTQGCLRRRIRPSSVCFCALCNTNPTLMQPALVWQRSSYDFAMGRGATPARVPPRPSARRQRRQPDTEPDLGAMDLQGCWVTGLMTLLHICLVNKVCALLGAGRLSLQLTAWRYRPHTPANNFLSAPPPPPPPLAPAAPRQAFGGPRVLAMLPALPRRQAPAAGQPLRRRAELGGGRHALPHGPRVTRGRPVQRQCRAVNFKTCERGMRKCTQCRLTPPLLPLRRRRHCSWASAMAPSPPAASGRASSFASCSA